MSINNFLTSSTLEAIDWGVLDLSKVDAKKRKILRHFEAMLTYELKENYKNNSFGIFRVSRIEDMWVYSDRITSQVFESHDIYELKKKVIKSDNIWYVFDDQLAGEINEGINVNDRLSFD